MSHELEAALPNAEAAVAEAAVVAIHAAVPAPRRHTVLRPEHKEKGRRKGRVIQRELDRYKNGRVPPAPPVAEVTGREIDRSAAAFCNGKGLKGLAVEAWDDFSGDWKQGVLQGTAVRRQPNQPDAGARHVIGVVNHADGKEKAYRVECLRRRV